jgi:hypothetical protein
LLFVYQNIWGENIAPIICKEATIFLISLKKTNSEFKVMKEVTYRFKESWRLFTLLIPTQP